MRSHRQVYRRVHRILKRVAGERLRLARDMTTQGEVRTADDVPGSKTRARPRIVSEASELIVGHEDPQRERLRGPPCSAKTPSAWVFGVFWFAPGWTYLPQTDSRGTSRWSGETPGRLSGFGPGAREERATTRPTWAPVAGFAGDLELRGEAIIVVEAAEHRACHGLDGAFPTRGRGCPR